MRLNSAHETKNKYQQKTNLTKEQISKKDNVMIEMILCYIQEKKMPNKKKKKKNF